MVTFIRPNHLPRFDDDAPNQPERAQRKHVVVPANVELLMELDGDALIYYRKYALRIPPVPSKLGALLYQTTEELRAFMLNPPKNGRQATAQYIALMQKIAKQCAALIRPSTKRDRWMRRFGLWQPLRDASDAEISELADFLLQRRAKSTIRKFQIKRG